MGLFDKVAVALLFLLGVWVVLGREALGWDGELGVVILRVLTGFLFLFLAGSIVERHRMRRRLNEITRSLNMLLYGRNYERDREAIRILLRGLDGADEAVRKTSWENLKALTGQDFALDADIWKTWWATNEKRFALKAGASGTKRPE